MGTSTDRGENNGSLHGRGVGAKHSQPGAWRAAAELAIAQLALVAVGFVALLAAPVAMGWGAWLPAGAVLGGAWLWARLRGRRHPGWRERARVRAVASRAGLVLATIGTTAYAVVALAAEEPWLPDGALLPVCSTLGLMGWATALGLTLCGLDLAR